MTRRDIEKAVWKVLLRGDRTELVSCLTDHLATAEASQLISTLGDEEYAKEDALNSLMIFANRFYGMANNTRMTLTMGE